METGPSGLPLLLLSYLSDNVAYFLHKQSNIISHLFGVESRSLKKALCFRPAPKSVQTSIVNEDDKHPSKHPLKCKGK